MVCLNTTKDISFPFLPPLLRDLCSLDQAADLYLHGFILACVTLSSPGLHTNTRGQTAAALILTPGAATTTTSSRPGAQKKLLHKRLAPLFNALSPMCVHLDVVAMLTHLQKYTHFVNTWRVWGLGGVKPRRSGHHASECVSNILILPVFYSSEDLVQ